MTAPEPTNPPADGCGCQYDAAGRKFRTRCICPPPTTPEQTLRGVAGLGGAIGDAVRDLLAERDALREHILDIAAHALRLRPIIDAAFAYADSTADTTDTPHEDALLDAVNDYRALGATDVA